jgi:hypothetical protein
MPMALRLILVAVAEERHSPSSGQSFDQAERELLAMVLNRSAALVDRAIQEKLLSVFR